MDIIKININVFYPDYSRIERVRIALQTVTRAEVEQAVLQVLRQWKESQNTTSHSVILLQNPVEKPPTESVKIEDWQWALYTSRNPPPQPVYHENEHYDNATVRQWASLSSQQPNHIHVVCHDVSIVHVYAVGARTISSFDVEGHSTFEALGVTALQSLYVLSESYPLDASAESLESDPIRREISPYLTYRSMFPWGLPANRVCLILKAKEPYRLTRMAFLESLTPMAPSSHAQTQKFIRHQSLDQPTTIFCGRPLFAQPPIPPTLLDATLAELRDNLYNIEPTSQDYKALIAVREELSGVFNNEAARVAALCEVLKTTGICPEGDIPVARICGPAFLRFKDDGDLRVEMEPPVGVGADVFVDAGANDVDAGANDVDARAGAGALYYLQEVKNEVDGSMANPYFQAIHHWVENWRQTITDAAGGKADMSMEKLNYPCIILLHYGVYLEVCAAAFGDTPTAETLRVVQLAFDDTNVHALEAAAKVVASLRVGLASLRHFYRTFRHQSRPLAPFPFVQRYEDDRGTQHIFKYVDRLPGRRIFRAIDNDSGERLVVKFVTHEYGSDAHTFAAHKGLAPTLVACHKVNDWVVVIMQDLSETHITLRDWKRLALDKAIAPGPEPVNTLHITNSVISLTRFVRGKLHAAGYIHGDLRDVNILVSSVWPPKADCAAYIVDWDWAGKKGEARYPIRINTVDIARHGDVSPKAPMEFAHDEFMMKSLWVYGANVKRTRDEDLA